MIQAPTDTMGNLNLESTLKELELTTRLRLMGWTRLFKKPDSFGVVRIRQNWLKSVEKNSDLFLQANHDGYMRIKEPVRHVRAIYNFDEINFIVKDTFFGKGVHTFELNYHVHPDSEITLVNNGWWKINHQGAVIYMRLLDENNFDVIKGQKDPLLGWYSPSYGIKCKSGVLSCTKKGIPKEVSLVTAICLEFPPETNILTQRLYKIERQIKNSQYLG